jgi:hypothetical protein
VPHAPPTALSLTLSAYYFNLKEKEGLCPKMDSSFSFEKNIKLKTCLVSCIYFKKNIIGRLKATCTHVSCYQYVKLLCAPVISLQLSKLFKK